ncbi:Complex1 LYR multi-domain protein [Pyrenophora teres f. teres]|uniref:Complex1 LYR multi-domain protein n=1 Tax=Pyrenophora teres f. teres TaxID=97479 RepID=A0A6S6W9L7_9PLEO|nr:Complex1 LYR multi-domain protein [Pyrenophora teres f. teres]
MVRLSGLQKDVLSLYRQCLRAVRAKPNDAQSHFRDFARAQFHKHKDVGKKDFGTIEYLLRRGRNQLESWSDPGIRDIHR